MEKKKIKTILENLSLSMERLAKTNLELKNPPSGQHRKLIGQIIVDGRAVTHVLQKLRNKVPDFDTWYKPFVDEMENDELMRFLYKLRSYILKEGDDHLQRNRMLLDSKRHYMSISDKGIEIQWSLPNGHFRHELIPKPSNAKRAFMGDSEGGCGWVIKNPDGSESKQYVNVPADICTVWFKFRNPPKMHLGKDISGLSAEEMCDLYVRYLSNLVKEAKKRFSHYSE